ncbi:hypothetical protein [Rhizosphaericola mali]|uniref:Uncharacterized protein n=1 Tax=Rhizosphaericola mali TaxID=2545455 RepID=A0A5P2FYK4_9BACT|nr:hypothetical protein [Rhizosphaericola mali]QES88586.1 hypothetical protein E0W69_007900 [Rhizosphaericola mali]
MSKFLIINNNKYRTLQEEILAFLWDNGNEILMDSDYSKEEIFKHFRFHETCIITIGDNNLLYDSLELDVPNVKMEPQACFSTVICWNLHFSHSGVYSNALPYPHRLFAFKSLELSELLVFFEWCLKMRLFTK